MAATMTAISAADTAFIYLFRSLTSFLQYRDEALYLADHPGKVFFFLCKLPDPRL
jgi:hypothetical protein